MTENILKVLEFTADKAQAIAGAQSVVGEPIVIGDVTVVPISAVDCGFAGGGSDLPAKQKNDALKPLVEKLSATKLERKPKKKA